MQHIPWLGARRLPRFITADRLDERRAFLTLANRVDGLLNHARRDTSAGAHP